MGKIKKTALKYAEKAAVKVLGPAEGLRPYVPVGSAEPAGTGAGDLEAMVAQLAEQDGDEDGDEAGDESAADASTDANNDGAEAEA